MTRATKTVLLIDDPSLTRCMAGFLLREAEFLVAEATYEEAVHMLAAGYRPDVVMIEMRPESGLSVLKAIRAIPHHRLTPIVMLTDTDKSGESVECMRAGASAWVERPLTIDALKSVIRVVHFDPPW